MGSVPVMVEVVVIAEVGVPTSGEVTGDTLEVMVVVEVIVPSGVGGDVGTIVMGSGVGVGGLMGGVVSQDFAGSMSALLTR
jgi:hypothetical protein